ncbi:type I methionyl aminopeptidase [Intrasporangium calvum]|uniref:Methionine aminopeptidase n=1 Tax=Intrasporangium calvum (strain ATCC 23552 / DSM 43043 / JCM 3097 / NBRC 12989 / NCIMB 10167 / NRRL B-3866 / 7 KIP) TaxID=710696 RepID=E6S960_INTC7|nr:type I methionyl aminopeptidase [Intrasporangium calvum]ADU49235.1 methionine aminopeptidase, type I [Intrasporangium calvum DSM 43043]AXG14161.1 type I methionyl aminopeptidase [Intrasporangium calvum]
MFGRRKLQGRTDEQLLLMREAGLLVGRTLEMLRERIVPGVTTLELDRLAEEFIRGHGGIPNFQLVPGYSHTLCTSVNDEVVHGIPGGRVLEAGDVVSVDCGAEVRGWNGDAAVSVVVGGPEAARPADLALIAATEASLYAGIAAMRVGGRLYAVGDAVEASIEASAERDGHTYGIVDEYVGHGIGTEMHMDPQIPNYAVGESGPKLPAGFTGAIEPMVTLGGSSTRVLGDDWTVVTADGTRAAHWEHSVAVRPEGLWVLTAIDGGQAALEANGAAYAPLG